MDDVRGLFLGMPHGTTPAAVTTNKNIIMSSFKSSRDIQKKEGGPDSCCLFDFVLCVCVFFIVFVVKVLFLSNVELSFPICLCFETTLDNQDFHKLRLLYQKLRLTQPLCISYHSSLTRKPLSSKCK